MKSHFFTIVSSLICLTAFQTSVADLVAHYPLDGDATDQSGNGNNGVIAGDVTPVEDRYGQPGGALLFKNAGHLDLMLNNGTLLVDKNPGGINTVTFWMLLDKNDNVHIPFSWNKYTLENWGNRFGFNTTHNDIYGIRSPELQDRWIHVAAVFINGNSMANKLYLDGQKQNIELMSELDSPNQANANATDNARLGGPFDPSAHYYLTGRLDDVYIYNHELSEIEIRTLAGKNIQGADLNIISVECSPDPPTAGEKTDITFRIKNLGNSVWNARSIKISLQEIDVLNKGKGDSFWLKTLQQKSQIRHETYINLSIGGNIQSGEEKEFTVGHSFYAPDFTDEFVLKILPGPSGEAVDDELLGNRYIMQDFKVEFNENAYLNCFGEILTGLTHGIINKTGLCWANLSIKLAWNIGTKPLLDIGHIYNLIKEGRVFEAGEKAVSMVIDVSDICIDIIKNDPTQCASSNLGFLGKFSTVLAFIEAAIDEFRGLGCGAVIVHEKLLAREMVSGMFAGLAHYIPIFKHIDPIIGVIAGCPVHLSVTDETGRTVSVSADGTTSTMFDSSLAFMFGDVKCALVNGTGEFNIQMEGDSSGVAELTVLQGKQDSAYNIISYQNIPISKGTKTNVRIGSQTTDYTMQIDVNGDGKTDFNREPDEIVTRIGKTGVQKPFEFDLEPNYPNPFNPVTTVPFYISTTADVSVSVYNVLGEKIKNLADKTVAAGYHELIWDGTDETGRTVSSGVYYFRFQAGGIVNVEKGLLLR